jgi:hypothetical protein
MGAGVSPSEHPAYLAPALWMFCLLSVVFSSISHCPQLGFYNKLVQDMRHDHLNWSNKLIWQNSKSFCDLKKKHSTKVIADNEMKQMKESSF